MGNIFEGLIPVTAPARVKKEYAPGQKIGFNELQVGQRIDLTMTPDAIVYFVIYPGSSDPRRIAYNPKRKMATCTIVIESISDDKVTYRIVDVGTLNEVFTKLVFADAPWKNPEDVPSGVSIHYAEAQSGIEWSFTRADAGRDGENHIYRYQGEEEMV